MNELGVPADAVRVRRVAECRYVGQAYGVQTALPGGSLAAAGAGPVAAAFEARYQILYKRTLPGGRVEALTWRIQVQGPVPSGRLRLTVGRDADVVKQGERMAVFPGHGAVSCLVLNRYGLRPGAAFPGPVRIARRHRRGDAMDGGW
jgi:N-methylhydantoinase A